MRLGGVLHSRAVCDVHRIGDLRHNLTELYTTLQHPSESLRCVQLDGAQQGCVQVGKVVKVF